MWLSVSVIHVVRMCVCSDQPILTDGWVECVPGNLSSRIMIAAFTQIDLLMATYNVHCYCVHCLSDICTLY